MTLLEPERRVRRLIKRSVKYAFARHEDPLLFCTFPRRNPEMTKSYHLPQEIFDDCIRHLLNQGHAAKNEVGNACQYRGADGTSCAVGFFLEDNDYNPSFEGCDLQSLIEDKAPLPAFIIDNSELLVDLQMLHDSLMTEDNELSFRQKICFRAYKICREHKLHDLNLRIWASQYGL